jgi:hypothetical protein
MQSEPLEARRRKESEVIFPLSRGKQSCSFVLRFLISSPSGAKKRRE